ncbi:MAG TPA: hypothetical protein VH854_07235 [Thermoanaerobaculia bacterium]|jgi:hypothetical protein|nr:hypothetical protein [Thermoanaerobaculia bacterium]
MRATFEAEGEIRGTDLLSSLVALWRDGASGTLQFSRSGATAGFDVAAGDVVRTASSDPRFDTAAILVRAGKLDQATLDRLPVGDGADRAALALQTGVLTRREWRWGEKIRAVEVLSDLLTWLEGEYWFFRTGGHDASEFRLTIPRLVLELFLRSRDRNLVLHYLGGVDVPLARAPRFDSEFPSFGLTADAESVVQLIDGERTAADIASEAPADAFAVEKLLAALVTLGLVHPEFAPGEAPPPAGPFEPAAPAESDAAEMRATEPPPAPKPEPAAAPPAPVALAARPADEEAARESEDETHDDYAHDDAGEEHEDVEHVEDVEEKEEPQARASEGEPAGHRVDDDAAETALAGGSFEEAAGPDRYDDELEEDEAEPQEDDEAETSRLDDHELDRIDGERRSALDQGGRGEAERGFRDVGGEPAGESGGGGPAAAPQDLLGFDEGAAAPVSPFDRPLDATTGIEGLERPRPRTPGPWVWVLAVLALAVIGLLLWRSREGTPGGEPAVPMAAARRRTPTEIQLSATSAPPAETPSGSAAAAPSPTPMRIGPTAAPVAVPTRPPAMRSPVPPARTAAPSRRSAPPTIPPSPRAASSSTATAGVPAQTSRPEASRQTTSRQDWLDRAEKDRKRFVQQGKARYAVQLELACEVPSLVDAFQHDRPAGSMWLLATPFEGRTCFRVLWGRYATPKEAARGLAKSPGFFATSRNHPAVVPVR